MISWVPNEKLKEIYSSHQFYLQLSMIEGFPNTLGEAMLCGCVPIGSDVASIPEIIGDCGFILKNKDPESLIELITRAKKSDLDLLSKSSIKRVREHWPVERRESELTALIHRLC